MVTILTWKFQIWKFEMILLSAVVTNLIALIVAMEGFTPKCKNIKEYSTAGLAARTKCPKCVEHHPGQKVKFFYITKIFHSKVWIIFQSGLTIVPRGQLGNHLYSYSLLVSLQEHYKNFKFYLSSESWKYITKYFNSSKLLLPSINDLCLCKSTDNGVYSKPFKWKFWNTKHGLDFVKVIQFQKSIVYLKHRVIKLTINNTARICLDLRNTKEMELFGSYGLTMDFHIKRNNLD